MEGSELWCIEAQQPHGDCGFALLLLSLQRSTAVRATRAPCAPGDAREAVARTPLINLCGASSGFACINSKTLESSVAAVACVLKLPTRYSILTLLKSQPALGSGAVRLSSHTETAVPRSCCLACNGRLRYARPAPPAPLAMRVRRWRARLSSTSAERPAAMRA